jgi:RNA polymerase sigma-70 factor (ECF subfamily)
VIACWGRRRGIQQADVDDVVQEVLTTPALLDFRRDHGSGSFIAFLYTIVRSRLVDQQQRQRRQPNATGGSDYQQRLEAIAEPPSADEASEFQQLALRQALDLVQPKVGERTWTAFWRVVVDGQDVALVAEQLGMTAGGVRVAKCRVLQRLRDELE